MALKLMYITNRPDVALVAEHAGVERIFIDMESFGKAERQHGLDSVKNAHTIEDVRAIRKVLTKSELLVRINPIHEACDGYSSSEEEIESVVNAGADIIMLPYFKTLEEVRRFLSAVNGRTKTMLLLETPEAVEIVDDIIAFGGFDEVHIGINDLCIGYGKTFLFELLADGTVETLCIKFKTAGIPYGFGGVASIGTGLLPAEYVLKEHYRLESSMVILSRSFCNANKDTDINFIREKFDIGMRSMKALENEIAIHARYFSDNEAEVKKCVAEIVRRIKSRDDNSDEK
ncbi:MAG: aldolase [Clostridia bacterium]|nr:aldolase [Clostridia bacterium]